MQACVKILLENKNKLFNIYRQSVSSENCLNQSRSKGQVSEDNIQKQEAPTHYQDHLQGAGGQADHLLSRIFWGRPVLLGIYCSIVEIVCLVYCK